MWRGREIVYLLGEFPVPKLAIWKSQGLLSNPSISSSLGSKKIAVGSGEWGRKNFISKLSVWHFHKHFWWRKVHIITYYRITSYKVLPHCSKLINQDQISHSMHLLSLSFQFHCWTFQMQLNDLNRFQWVFTKLVCIWDQFRIESFLFPNLSFLFSAVSHPDNF